MLGLVARVDPVSAWAGGQVKLIVGEPMQRVAFGPAAVMRGKANGKACHITHHVKNIAVFVRLHRAWTEATGGRVRSGPPMGMSELHYMTALVVDHVHAPRDQNHFIPPTERLADDTGVAIDPGDDAIVLGWIITQC